MFASRCSGLPVALCKCIQGRFRFPFCVDPKNVPCSHASVVNVGCLRCGIHAGLAGLMFVITLLDGRVGEVRWEMRDGMLDRKSVV